MKLLREQIIAYAIRYQGEYQRIVLAIKNNEAFNYEESREAITIVDEDYPEVFWQLRYPPLCLFYIGDKSRLKRKIVAIVGSRESSEIGIKETKTIVKYLKTEYDILSGMARGIDGAAHRAAISEAKVTIGILANGIDYCYPQENYDLYLQMVATHLILSEYPGKTKPQRRNFPFRNRLIAALADKVVVPELKIKSGTMITVDLALELSREVYCLPKLLSDQNTGNNYLIRQGANMICTLEDIRNI